MAAVNLELPEQFLQLEKHSAWICGSQQERMRLRAELPFEAIEQFHDEVLSELPAILAYLSERPEVGAEPEDLALYSLAASLIFIAHAVETYGENGVTDGADFRRFVPAYERPVGVAPA